MKINLAIFALFATCIISAEVYPQEKETTPNLSGNWTGSWFSEGSGHKGPMKAIFKSSGNDTYEVAFSGRFLKFIPFRYKVHLTVTGKEGKKLILNGNQKLLGFGIFEYNAIADDTSFIANYSSKKDNGRFELYRSK